MAGKKNIGRTGGCGWTQRVKTAAKRSVSSTRWLGRQLNDPYVAEAQRLNYRSRAAFKIVEIDERFDLFSPGKKVIDLGAAPGSWSQIAAMQVKSAKGEGRVIAIDLLDMMPIVGVDFLQMDFFDKETPTRLRTMLGSSADIIMSDMAANTTGHRQTDHLKIMALCESALSFARLMLKPGGTFVAKVLRGGTETGMLNSMKRDFSLVRHIKPAASRLDSAEMYVVASKFRNAPIISS